VSQRLAGVVSAAESARPARAPEWLPWGIGVGCLVAVLSAVSLDYLDGEVGPMRWRIFVPGLSVLGSVLLLASAPSPVGAGIRPGKGPPYRVKDLHVVSGPSPFGAGCPGARFDDTAITGHELEPMITVNPANRRNIVAT
jgi:hypothetical protein